MAKLVAKTYGEALYEIATEQSRGREMMEEILAVQEVLAQNPDFHKLMQHPGVPKQEKTEVVEYIFKGRISDELTGFLKLVVAKERYGELQAIFQFFIDKVKEADGIGVAYVSSAVELTNSQREAVMAKLIETTSYRTMEIHYQVDAALIGGMIIRVGDRVVDSSIQSKLEALTKQLLQIQLA